MTNFQPQLGLFQIFHHVVTGNLYGRPYIYAILNCLDYVKYKIPASIRDRLIEDMKKAKHFLWII